MIASGMCGCPNCRCKEPLPENISNMLEKQHMKLSEKLKNTLDDLEKAGIKNLQAQAAADMKKIRKEREEDQKYLDFKKASIVTAIDEGKVPLLKVKDYSRQDWLRSLDKGKGRNQDLWTDFRQYFRSEGIEVVLTEDHDGVGMESWINMSVKVLPPRVRAPVRPRDTDLWSED
jgi:hypothetical protein